MHSRWVMGAVLAAACGGGDDPASPDAPPVDAAPADAPPDGLVADSHVELFGYVGVSCGTEYLAEVADFTNLGHMCIFEPGDIRAKLDAFRDAGVGALLDLHFLLFTESTEPPLGGSGSRYVLRPDYEARWAEFLSTNRTSLTPAHVAALYPAEEPTWLGVSAAELQTVATMMQRDLPELPTLLVEAHQAIGDVVVPVEYDIVGMDFYGAVDPLDTPTSDFSWLNQMYRGYYDTMLAQRSRPEQRVMLVFDAQYAGIYGKVGYQPADLGSFVTNHYAFAQAHPEVIGMLGYVYFSGLDGPDYMGLRDLPVSVKDANRTVGRAITGK